MDGADDVSLVSICATADMHANGLPFQGWDAQRSPPQSEAENQRETETACPRPIPWEFSGRANLEPISRVHSLFAKPHFL